MSRAAPTDGTAELALLEALLDGSAPGVTAAVAMAAAAAAPPRDLPGTHGGRPDRYDLDAFGFNVSMPAFAMHVPREFSVSVGGPSVPNSSFSLNKQLAVRFVGTANSNIYFHVPSTHYEKIFENLPPSAPSPHLNHASATARKTLPITALVSACRQAAVPWVILTCYGLEAAISVSFDEDGEVVDAQFPPHMGWIQRCMDFSSGARIDVGAVWNAGGDSYTFSLPGKGRKGMLIFEICALQQVLSRLLGYLGRHPTDPLAEHLPKGGGWRSGTALAGRVFFSADQDISFQLSSSPAARSLLKGGGIFQRRACPGGLYEDRSGVVEVSLYNHHDRHAGVAVEPVGGYEQLGTGRAPQGPLPVAAAAGALAGGPAPPWGGGAAAAAAAAAAAGPPAGSRSTHQARQHTKELNRQHAQLARSVALVASFGPGQRGGVRAEARVIKEGSSYSAADALLDGVRAALYMGDSRKSGLEARSVIKKATFDRLVTLALALASRSRGRDSHGALIQVAVSQLGQHIRNHAPARDGLWSGGGPLLPLLRAATVSALLVEAGAGAAAAPPPPPHSPPPSTPPSPSSLPPTPRLPASPSESSPARSEPALGSDGDSDDDGGTSTANTAAVPLLSSTLLGSLLSEAAIQPLMVVTALEKLSDEDARRSFHGAAEVRRVLRCRYMGPVLDTYDSQQLLPTARGTRQRCVLAAGSLAECMFAHELHLAFLQIGHERATRLTETQTARLAFKRGESRRAFRFSQMKGSVKGSSPDINDAARAIASCHAASILVWTHHTTMNEAIAAQAAVIPKSRGDATDELRERYIALGAEAAAAYYDFREAAVSFIRARHQLHRQRQQRPTWGSFDSGGPGAAVVDEQVQVRRRPSGGGHGP